MGDIPDHFIPIIAGCFFVSSAIAGICLYCCYFKTRKHKNKTSGQSRNSVKRSYRASGESGHFPSYRLHSNPFIFYVGPAPYEFSDAPFAVEMESERNLPSSPCYFVEEHCIKLPEKKRVCRSASSGKPVRSPCHLQVITEAEEENEEEANEAQPEKTNI